MAYNSGATLIPDSGNYFTAPVGTAAPADLSSVSAPWVNVGHTSLEDILSISSEGGEKTVLGTLQNKQLRTKYSARTETMNFTLQQFDEDSLKLYFGSNMANTGDANYLGVSTDPTPTQAAFLIVFVDASNMFSFWVPKADIFRGDDMSLGDSETLAGLPIAVTPLVHGTNTWTYAVSPITGTPGS